MTVRFSRPETLEQAFDELQDEDAHLLAGGVSLVLLMNVGLLHPHKLVSLAMIPGLHGIEEVDGLLDIGALTTHDQLARSPVLQAKVPAATDLFSRIGNVRVRCAGTIGGNLAHADPAQDPVVLLTVLGASAVMEGPSGRREVPVEELADGPLIPSFAHDEILTGVHVPLPDPQDRCAYVKFLSGTVDDYATVSVACRLTVDDAGRVERARLAAGAVGGTVVVLDDAAQRLIGQDPSDPEVLAEVDRAVRDRVDPAPDRRGSADYKRAMAGTIAQRAVQAGAAEQR